MEKISNNEKSQVLIDALPYIQKYNNKILVIKYGGNAMTNKELKDAVMTDIVLLSLVGVKVVLVHGGGPEISDMLKKLNIESRFVNGLRYTDDATVDVVKMVLSGKVNKELVQLLAQHKGSAVGLCGIDGEMLMAEKKKTDDGQDLGWVGEITKVNTKPITDAYHKGKFKAEYLNLDSAKPEKVIEEIKKRLGNAVVFGIGNIHGIGEELIEGIMEIGKSEKEEGGIA